MKVFAIIERESEEEETTIIGIAESLYIVPSMIEKYFGKGKFKEKAHHDIRDSMIEYTKFLEVDDEGCDPYQVIVTVMEYELNEI